MEKKKFKKTFIDLSEEDIKNMRKEYNNAKLQLDNTNTAVEGLRKEIELDLPTRNAKSQLAQLAGQLELLQSNVKVYEKQLRTKKVVQRVPV